MMEEEDMVDPGHLTDTEMITTETITGTLLHEVILQLRHPGHEGLGPDLQPLDGRVGCAQPAFRRLAGAALE